MPAPALAPRHRAFCLPRGGHEAGECQDAWAVAARGDRFAVADGATESAWSGTWARQLVEAFVAGPEGPPGWVGTAQQRWLEAVPPSPDGEPMPWFLQEQHEQGSFATFLGLVVRDGQWQAQAVGDSCLFQVRANRLLRAFPLTTACQFSNTPPLLGSRDPVEGTWPGQVEAGELRRGDRLWLMTDALAQWFLAEAEAGRRPWLALHKLLHRPDGAFSARVARWRDRKALRNDDTTLLAIWA
jgi:hypothetical protein